MIAIANGTCVSFYNQPNAAFTPAQLVAGNKHHVARSKLLVARNKLHVARNMLLQATSCAQLVALV